jgi:hypothetical protein
MAHNTSTKCTSHLVLLLLIVGLSIFWSTCSKATIISKEEAERIAASEIEKYASKEGVPLSQFGEPRVRYNEQVDAWEIYYKSESRPIHHVSILIDRFRNVELLQDIEQMQPTSSSGE